MIRFEWHHLEHLALQQIYQSQIDEYRKPTENVINSNHIRHSERVFSFDVFKIEIIIYIMFSAESLTKVITWIFWIWVTWYWRFHWFHYVLSVTGIYEFTISHTRKTHRQFFIVMFFRITDVKVHRMLEKTEIEKNRSILLKSVFTSKISENIYTYKVSIWRVCEWR